MHSDNQGQIFDDEILLGKLDGFIFQSAENFFMPSDEEELKKIDSFILDVFIKKIDELINAGDAALRFNQELQVTFKDNVIAKLLPTDDILKPDFTPILDDRIQGIALARLALHLESWLKRQINAIADSLDTLNKTEDLSVDGKEFIKELTKHLGYVPRHKIDALVKKISPEDRVKLRKSGVRFAQYGIFMRDLLKPGAQKIKLILWALKNNIPLPEVPPSGVVSIPFNPDVPEGYYDIAGYKICGDYAVRSDMIEKLADAIRPIALKSDENPKGEFEITAQHMSFVGKSGEAFEAIMKSLGYDFRTETVKVTSVAVAEAEDYQASEDKVNKEIAEKAVSETLETLEDAEKETVTVEQKEVEKQIWFWAPPSKNKTKSFLKKDYGASENLQDGNSEHRKKKFLKGKKPNSRHKNKSFDKKKADNGNQSPSPYVQMPKKHKISKENNPFAALMDLKKDRE